ncbi:MAG: hypothetical protein GDA42_00350 [Ekhidna sp.]|nr:hypothetical protein [Ekhidna sp.]MBC6408910.1 hypothetical protein [Ekhidna sp.]
MDLLPTVFEILHKKLIESFYEEYGIETNLLLDYQLYGFDLYDESSPNIKTYIHEKTGIHINGKYLYNKQRDYCKGKKEITFTNPYTYVYFKALGYENLLEFLNNINLNDEDFLAQQRLSGVGMKNELPDEYYVGYYYGEDYEIIKTKLTIYNNYQNVDWTLVYWENEEEPSQYVYRGIVAELRGTTTFYFAKEDAYTDRNVMISVFMGNKHIVNRPFIMGVYSGFDRNNCPVGGRIIFERYPSEKEQEASALSRDVDITIGNEVVNERIRVDPILPQTKSELSKESKDAVNLLRYEGRYEGYLIDPRNGDLKKAHMTIRKNSNHASLIFTDRKIYSGYFKLFGNGSVLYGFFGIRRSYYKIILILDSDFLEDKYLTGIYTGTASKNQPNGGRICFIRDVGVPDDDRQAKLLYAKNVPKPDSFLYDFFLGKKDLYAPSFSTLKKLNSQFGEHLNNEYLRSWSGTYLVYYRDEDIRFVNKEVLNIMEIGNIFLKSTTSVYTGNARIFGSGFLALNITKHNNADFYAQLLIFIGRFEAHEITQLTGTFNTLGKDMSPTAYRVVLRKSEEPYQKVKPQRLPSKGKQISSLFKPAELSELLITPIHSLKPGTELPSKAATTRLPESETIKPDW